MTTDDKSSERAEQTSSPPPKFAFLIGPIGTRGTEIRYHADTVLRYIVRPALEPEFNVKRGDEDERSGLISHHTFLDINSADLIVADLSLLNANAFYELGVAHAIGKRIIHICADDTTLPFDVKDYRSVIFDRRDPVSHEQASRIVRIYAASVMKEDNPLNPYTAAIGRKEAISKDNAREKSLEQLYKDVDDIKRRVDAFLDYRSANSYYMDSSAPGSSTSVNEDIYGISDEFKRKYNADLIRIGRNSLRFSFPNQQVADEAPDKFGHFVILKILR
jgi:hypothetical protein